MTLIDGNCELAGGRWGWHHGDWATCRNWRSADSARCAARRVALSGAENYKAEKIPKNRARAFGSKQTLSTLIKPLPPANVTSTLFLGWGIQAKRILTRCEKTTQGGQLSYRTLVMTYQDMTSWHGRQRT